ncbi:START domain-containing protein [Aliamphritea ceti]|uniref:START domain-containing protein n=1 Tax=Aliamphritea ceti TaxID=1524258 RepID=UPI0021C388DB|nr:START domain-containing protein [Aliamphritea ceti]
MTDSSALLTTRTVRYTFLAMMWIALSGCSSFNQQPSDNTTHGEIYTALYSYPVNDQEYSPFKQVRAHFIVKKPPTLVFRVLSDLQLTPSWFSYLRTLDTLEIYSPRSFLTRATLESPWPFLPRDLISCVTTHFAEQQITIKLKDCYDKYPLQERSLRITASDSQWIITKLGEDTRIEYQAWTDPGGNVPAFVYNSLLIDTTQETLNKLKQIINARSLSDYSY